MCVFSRYMTALTDSEEGEQSEREQSGEEEAPVDELAVLLGRVDVLHSGTEDDKRESLATLLEKKEEVSHINHNGPLSPNELHHPKVCFLKTCIDLYSSFVHSLDAILTSCGDSSVPTLTFMTSAPTQRRRKPMLNLVNAHSSPNPCSIPKIPSSQGDLRGVVPAVPFRAWPQLCLSGRGPSCGTRQATHMSV